MLHKSMDVRQENMNHETSLYSLSPTQKEAPRASFHDFVFLSVR